MKNRKYAIQICVGLMILAVISWLITFFAVKGNNEKSASATVLENFVSMPADQSADLHIKDVVIEKRRIAQVLRITGQIKPQIGQEVDVNTRFSGRVISVKVLLGQKVKAGTTLSIIDSREIGDLQAELIEAKSKLDIARAHQKREQQIFEEQLLRPAALTQARADFNQMKARFELGESEYLRQEQLHKEKITSTKDFVRAKTNFETAQADFTEAKLSLEREERLFANRAMMRRDVDVAKAETNRAEQHFSTLKQRLIFFGVSPAMVDAVVRTGKIQVLVPLLSPADGVVTEVDATVGEIIDPDKVAFRVTNLESVAVTADLPEIDLPKVKLGGSVKVKIATYPNDLFVGTINYISQYVHPDTRTVAIRASLNNEDGRLRSNMFVVMEIEGEAADMLACPKSALQERDGHKVVYVRVKDGYQERMITTGRQSEELVEVLSGLSAGDKVATEGSLMLKTEITYKQAGITEAEHAHR